MILSIGTFLYCKGKSLNTKSNMSQAYIATVDTASIDKSKIMWYINIEQEKVLIFLTIYLTKCK